ncbi:MAG: DUF362 domain-containing protein [Deltaproteobacteria bacterium]|nr:DUF362 domain-containing protein [Deltaproteobacteria bacterium]
MAIVTLAKVDDRTKGVQRSLKAVDMDSVKGKEVLIKPNFNTADITPGSTHNDTLVALVEELWGMGARSVSLGERSYPSTQRVMEDKGILPLLKKRDVKVIDFDTLQEKDWVHFQPKESHWPEGFRVARPIIEAEYLISTCCLKTHQYGGVFTMSLKLHVGTVPTDRHGFPYMGQLHQSPHQEKMIAEINAPFSPNLILLDGIDAFVDGGPAFGERAKGNVFLASRDRVATDAVGVAVLKVLGSNNAIMGKAIFQQEQIARAVELGIGVSSPAEIEMVPADLESEEYCKQVAAVLKQG